MNDHTVRFQLGGITFEYDEEKNQKNIKDHGLSFLHAARVFFDYDRIEYYDEENSEDEDRYDTIGDLSAGMIKAEPLRGEVIIGNIMDFPGETEEIVYVVYTERSMEERTDPDATVTRLISARFATNFERGLYYGKHD